MQTRIPTRSLRRFLLASAAVLPPAALLAAAIIPAMGARPSHAASAPAAIQHITIKTSAPRFPTRIAAGIVSVTLVADAKGVADASFARAARGTTPAVMQSVVAGANTMLGYIRLTQVLTFIGGVNKIPTGLSETVVLDMRTPGLYGVDITIGPGPDQLHTFTVAPSSGQGATMPTNGIPVTLKDMKFLGLPKQLAAGPVSFQFTNSGPSAHEMALARLDPGKTQTDVINLFKAPGGPSGPPAWAHLVGGLDSISPHQVATLQVNLTPGYYMVLCLMPDVHKQGMPHASEGMIAHIIVR